MSRVRSIQSIYRQLKPKLIICDFDGCLTDVETITPLMKLAKRNWTQNEHDMFTKHTEWYKTNHTKYEKELLFNLNEYKHKLTSKLISWNLNDLAPLLKDCDQLDVESLTKLDLNKNYLSNISLNELSQIFINYIRPHVNDLLQECISDGCIIKVLSHNWCSYTIYYALNEIINRDNIICNEMECNDLNITTGKLLQKCVTSIDKMNYVNQWKHHYKYRNVMYIGDQVGDLLANCCVDISVWMKTSTNQPFIDIVSDNLLMGKEQTCDRSVFVTDSWI